MPPSLLKQEYDTVARAMNPNAAKEHHKDQDHKHDQPAVDDGMSTAEKDEAEKIATRRVRLGLLITEIGRVNSIDVTEDDTRQAVFEEARRYPGQEQMVLEHFQKNPEAMQQISGPIFEDKVIDFILEIAKVSEVVIDKNTLYQAEESVAASAKKKAKKSAKKPVNKKLPTKNVAAQKKPVTKKPVTKKPATKKSATKKPATKKPVTRNAATKK